MQQPMKVWSMSGQFRLCPVLHLLLGYGGALDTPSRPAVGFGP
jgi:hypothetical protein